MTVHAARTLGPGTVCFVGIGLPSPRRTWPAGSTRPTACWSTSPAASARSRRCSRCRSATASWPSTADPVVSVPEIFAYWLQAGRIDVGFLSAAQIDRYANINSTVIGDYRAPAVRLPGAGGAPEIAANCGEVVITIRQNLRTFVERLDFVTSVGLRRRR